MKPKPPTIQSVVDNFAKNYSPFLRVMMLPAMVAPLAHQNFDELWSQIEPHIRDDLLSRERSCESVAMVERWAREAYELALRHRSERDPQDSTVEPSPEKGGLSL